MTAVQLTFFKCFENYPAGISFSQCHIPGTGNGHGNYTKFEGFISHTSVKLHP
jgi:hypothetical protein